MGDDHDRPSTSASGATAMAAALAVAGLLLLATAPSPGGSLRTLLGLTSGLDPLDPAAPVLAVLGLAAWALTAYLALGIGLVLLGRLPGLAGRLGSAVARRTVPVAVRRTVETVLGAGLVLGALGAVPASAATPHVAPASTSAASTSTASLDWPVTTPSAPDEEPPPPPATPTPPDTRPAPGTTHVVRPGDTLWDLAAQALRTTDGPGPTDRAVAAAWPSWWEANRDAIGDDPHLLHPGTALVAPPAAP